ncbi:2Fe-2S iron-sulfur cluster-binding protein [Altericista sp. CCNU0014]|uniref:2Fe-2S iron-sulfur cluster-binding protein n=1 Tax=Altericista sp. CCNU0014 TaxID=3082949 RepID=UPI00384D5205
MGNTYTAEISHDGTLYTVTVPDDQTVLASAQAAGVDLPTSCGAGVCTTCAAQILEGDVEQVDAMGLGPEIVAKGYALLCVSYPRSNLKIESNKEDIVYGLQFGQS